MIINRYHVFCGPLLFALACTVDIFPPGVEQHRDNVVEAYEIEFLTTLSDTDLELLQSGDGSGLIGGSTLTDKTASFPIADLAPGELPEGLRGAFVTIISDTENAESIGQTRLILFNTATKHCTTCYWQERSTITTFITCKLYPPCAKPLHCRIKD